MAVVTRVRGNEIIHPVVELMAQVIKKEDTHHILQIDLTPLEIVVQDIAALQELQEPPETVKIWLQLLLNSLAEATRLLDRSGRRQRCLDWLVNNPRRQSQQIRGWNALFDRLSHLIPTELLMWLNSLHFLSSKPLCKELRGVAEPGSVDSMIIDAETLSEEEAEITDAETLSGEEAWMLFRRVAFREERVSVDIEKRARMIAEECRGRRLAINVVAKSMIGQSSVHEWDVCLSSLKKVHPSFPAIQCSLDAELYRSLRWSYDSLPNSIVKNCFLYCALYKQGQEIDSRELVQMWIGEGLIKSKQGAYLMDMAIGRNYVKLLIDRCLFHIIKESTTNVFRHKYRSGQYHDVFPSIGVYDVIREMAVYIAQKEQNCVLMSTLNPPNLPESCTRISLQLDNYTGDLPTDLRCPDLASLSLQGNTDLELLPTELVLSRLTSLRVLNMSGCTKITSVPTSVGQLRLLQFLSLSGLPIKDLGEDICHLSQLQFLDLSWCPHLQSLPSQIGELKKLKHLNLNGCVSLKMIPRQISDLISLSRLHLSRVLDSNVEMLAPASVRSLMGLQNLTELNVRIEGALTHRIMETWSEMRHFVLWSDDLPDDMQTMKKLESFMLMHYTGLTLPDSYKFQHLEVVKLMYCTNIRELSPLEWLPNLKYLKLLECSNLSELGIGSRVPSGYRRLQILILKSLSNLESLGGPSNAGVWDESTLPHLRVLKITSCPRLKRLPMGMEKLRNLCELQARHFWWDFEIMWDDDNMRAQLQKFFVGI